MIDNEHVLTLNETGKWLLSKARELATERRKKKRYSKKLEYRWNELNARMNILLKDFKKITDEGEGWKNEN